MFRIIHYSLSVLYPRRKFGLLESVRATGERLKDRIRIQCRLFQLPTYAVRTHQRTRDVSTDTGPFLLLLQAIWYIYTT